MIAFMFLSFTGWELVGFLFWVAVIVAVALWGSGRDAQDEKDRAFARRHRI